MRALNDLSQEIEEDKSHNEMANWNVFWNLFSKMGLLEVKFTAENKLY